MPFALLIWTVNPYRQFCHSKHVSGLHTVQITQIIIIISSLNILKYFLNMCPGFRGFFLDSKYPQCLTEDVEQIYVRIPYTIFVDPFHSFHRGLSNWFLRNMLGFFRRFQQWNPKYPFPVKHTIFLGNGQAGFRDFKLTEINNNLFSRLMGFDWKYVFSSNPQPHFFFAPGPIRRVVPIAYSDIAGSQEIVSKPPSNHIFSQGVAKHFCSWNWTKEGEIFF